MYSTKDLERDYNILKDMNDAGMGLSDSASNFKDFQIANPKIKTVDASSLIMDPIANPYVDTRSFDSSPTYFIKAKKTLFYDHDDNAKRFIYEIRKVNNNNLIDIAQDYEEAQKIMEKQEKYLTKEEKETDIDDFFYIIEVEEKKKYLVSIKSEAAEGLLPFSVVDTEEDAKCLCESKNRNVNNGNVWVYNEVDYV